MKTTHKIALRMIQGVTGLLVAGIIVMILAYTGVLPLPGITKPTPIKKPVEKVERPRSSGIASLDELITTGDSAREHGDIDAAIEAYEEAATASPQEPLPYEKLGDLHFSEKNYESAFQHYNTAAGLGGVLDPELPMKMAKSTLGQRNILAAQERFSQIKPETAESKYYLGMIAATLNDPDRAKDLLRSAQNSPDASDEIKKNVDSIMSAYIDYDIAREAPPEYLQALLAQSFNRIGECPLSIELSFAALKAQHDYRDVWLIMGHCFLQERKSLDAEDAFTKALDLDSTNNRSFFFRGVSRIQSGEKQKIVLAIKDFEDALAQGWQPKVLAMQYMADAYFDLKDFEKAFTLYVQITDLDPTDINRFVRPMALAINHIKKPLEAKKLAQKAADTHPDTAMGLNLLGWAASANGQLADARIKLNASIKKDPDLAAPYLNLGQLSEREGKTDEALSWYVKAIETAKRTFDSSIGETAKLRYDRLKAGESPEAESAPDSSTTSTSVPSLNLL